MTNFDVQMNRIGSSNSDKTGIRLDAENKWLIDQSNSTLINIYQVKATESILGQHWLCDTKTFERAVCCWGDFHPLWGDFKA